jgi:hypothetical protein
MSPNTGVQPPTTNLSQITRISLLDMGREIFSKAWAEKWASAGKDDLVKELDLAFEAPAKFAGNKERWVCASLR